jgi:hypothetical protein
MLCPALQTFILNHNSALLKSCHFSFEEFISLGRKDDLQLIGCIYHHFDEFIYVLIDLQHDLASAQKCDVAVQIFELIRKHLFYPVNEWPTIAENSSSYFITTIGLLKSTLILQDPSQSLYFPHDFLISKSYDYSGIASILHNHAVCLSQVDR